MECGKSVKIWLYRGGLKLIRKSGIGKAWEHQKSALEKTGVAYTQKFSFDYDIVQLNTIFPDSVLAALLAKVMRKKVVYYAHSTMEDFKKSFRGSDFLAPFFKKWIRFCYCLGDVIITPTKYSKELLEDYGINKEILYLSNGIDLDFFNRDEESGKSFREKYRFDRKDKVVISVGHYIERKGIEDFVELAGRIPEYQFIWFGDTNLKLVPDNIKKAVETKLPNLHFPGYISSEELKQAYCGSDLFLFLTKEETEGIVLLEALALKIPALIRDIPVYEGWLFDREQIYKGRSLEEFEKLIRDILKGEVPLLTEEGYEKAGERSIEKIGEALKGIYSNVFEPEKSGASRYSYKNI
ncbi:1,2-diacylglycerol-3-alpha-glucose alpha-1,2-glucosyltransferase [Anaerocolumna xylanovorans DSM 12503]|uniref:1,2-diacylglycerol-3-alpha-glucose alpha-1,2-glucosyltransferase n=1 Tax=Anaerocolumna xylanovorans DSM 12503 TaxID=1121345 RepID=A0A1M7YC59_9FIRM|nr:1,2-diacylglycerol-3-alpha-glucose alpha-1,2-glucosyltransferase [Anaerocolumna xylanovorans DSM 12503]